MIKLLTLLGIVLVILAGGLTALSEEGAAVIRSEQAEGETEPSPVPEATSTPEPITNREDCAAIRGNEYLSREEREWFLANCVRR